MNLEELQNFSECPRPEIAAYVDGELTPREEFELEMHFAACASCAEELNEQKKLLRALDFVLEEPEIELPKDFTKVVVANAESRVSGLRGQNERYNALFVCSALSILVFAFFGSEAQSVLASSRVVVEQLFALGGFLAHLSYDIAVGATVVVRSLCFRFVFNSAISLVLVTIVFGFSALIFSRLMLRYKRI